MSALVIVGAILIVLGLVGLIYGGITYEKDQETADLGIFKVKFSNTERLHIHPVLGGVILAAGIVVLGMGLKSKHA